MNIGYEFVVGIICGACIVGIVYWYYQQGEAKREWHELIKNTTYKPKEKNEHD